MLIVFSIIIISYASQFTEVAKDVGIELIQDCTNKTIISECSETRQLSVCSDEPINKSCSMNDYLYKYPCNMEVDDCKTNTISIQTKYMISTSEYSLDFKKWGNCNYQTNADELIIICDSIYDGNGDSICSSGESCTKIIITASSIKEYYLDDYDNWAETKTIYHEKELEKEIKLSLLKTK